MLKTGQTKEDAEISSPKYPDIYSKDGFEEELERYTQTALNEISIFQLIIKPAIISLIALVISFFLDLSNVPLLGDITVKIAHSLFPAWNPEKVQSLHIVFGGFLLLFMHCLFSFLTWLIIN